MAKQPVVLYEILEPLLGEVGKFITLVEAIERVNALDYPDDYLIQLTDSNMPYCDLICDWMGIESQKPSSFRLGGKTWKNDDEGGWTLPKVLLLFGELEKEIEFVEEVSKVKANFEGKQFVAEIFGDGEGGFDVEFFVNKGLTQFNETFKDGELHYDNFDEALKDLRELLSEFIYWYFG